MKRFLLPFLFVLCFSGCQHVHHFKDRKIRIANLSMKYRSDNDFKGIIESFTKTESKGGHIILRTDENQRSGLYFTVTFNNSLQLLPPGCRIRLSFVTNDSPMEQVQMWKMPEVKHSLLFQNELYLGITDAEKALASPLLVAWKVEILSREGQVLATQKSYAWE